jgi:hypothetical protein
MVLGTVVQQAEKTPHVESVREQTLHFTQITILIYRLRQAEMVGTGIDPSATTTGSVDYPWQ